MNKVEDYERIRKAYYIEGVSIGEISRRYGHGRRFVHKAIDQSRPEEYQLTKPRPDRVLGPFKKRIGELIEESKTLPKEQRYTAVSNSMGVGYTCNECIRFII
jgi:transposase